mgnify:CR=1 FL=1
MIAPGQVGALSKTLQEDDTDTVYMFNEKFPDYSPSNIASKGVVDVSGKQFYLVEGTHPLVQAIAENQDQLQMGEICMM